MKGNNTVESLDIKKNSIENLLNARNNSHTVK